VVKGNDQTHAEHLDANTTKELAERNKLVANDLNKAISDLNQTADTKPPSIQDIIKGRVDRINALLQEAITVRVEKNELTSCCTYTDRLHF
jgi:hypothetical protein